MSFEPNRGQFDRRFDFGTRGFGYSLLLNATTVKLKFHAADTPAPAALEMNLHGANPHATLRGSGALPGESNYFQGTPESWLTHIPTYQRVQINDVYPGVDAVYYGNSNQLEYDFTVQPGASAEVIDIGFDHGAKLMLSDNGDLLISVNGREMRQLRPTTYQNIDGRTIIIESRYVFHGEDRVGFDVAAYDHRRPLIIDPQLVYSTFAGGRIYGIAVDSAGSAYLAGTSPDPRESNATDAFAEKLNAAGTAALWASSFGSNGYGDSATAIAVDGSGNAYVTGWTIYQNSGPQFPTFPTTPNAIQPKPPAGDGNHAFVTKFDTNGNIVYSTYLGGTRGDRGDGIAVDSLGNIYVTGQTISMDFPTSRPFQSSLRGSGNAFVSVLNAQGTGFVYSTYLGGGSDAATAIAVDGSGNAYVTGYTTSSPDFPTANPIQASNAGGSDAFVVKLNPAGSALVYGTFLGGAGQDIAKAIAIDSSDNAYVTGSTNSTNFPTVNAFQPTLAGSIDAFVTKINSTGTALVYSTYLGGSDDETTGGQWCEEKGTCSGGIVVNPAGNAYVTGVTASVDFPQMRSLQSLKGITDAYVTEFSADGKSLVYSTLIGGANEGDTNTPPMGSPNNAFTSGSAVAYLNGNLYVAGLTDAYDFTGNPNAQGTCCVNPSWNGVGGFAVKLADDTTTSGGGGGTSTFTRVEQNSSAVSYTGNWYSNSGSFNSGGSAVLAEDKGSRATFTFNGTDVRWIGYKDGWSGIANIYVDGVLKTTVDAYFAGSQAQAVLYTLSGLAAGTHTLAVEASGNKNPSSQGAWIWVDAFDFANNSSGGSGGGGSGGGGSGGGGGGTSTFTRVEQNSTSVTYTGNWYSNSGSFNSGGSAVLAEDKGSRATFTFNGTDVRWIGYKDGWSGIANIYVDGVLKTTVDAYFAGSQAQAVLYTLSGLAAGTHTLAVEASGNKNPSSQGAWIWVDAFDFANNSSGGSGGGGSGGGGSGGGGGGTSTFTRVEQNSTSVTYTGNWYSNSGSFNSGGSAVLAEDKGSRATFTFNGTDVRWIGYRDGWSGIANIYVDGVLKTTVDAYSAGSQAQAVLYTISGLAAGTHTLAVEASGNKNPSSQGAWIWVDAFDFANNGSGGSGGGGSGGGGGGTPTFTRVEQNSSSIAYTGTWYSNSGAFNSGGSAVLALNPGARATFTFTGTAVKWIGYRDQWSGIANVYIDGTLKGQVDTYSASEQADTVMYSISGLNSGNHTITIEVTGNKDASAQSPWVWVDAFDYLQ